MTQATQRTAPQPLQQVKPEPVEIAPAAGKLGVLLPGMGAVATTFMAGVEAGALAQAEIDGNEHQAGAMGNRHHE